MEPGQELSRVQLDRGPPVPSLDRSAEGRCVAPDGAGGEPDRLGPVALQYGP